ncbi:hypothetical protein GXP67_12760 [Rhodocytophaga rosea]|uniref:Uncharacterized protein n=1 Tax=Rhodocytophaga rosea TaxID=2704465 RepID=A0A6C0GHG0_9BACT|nr:hypothetical protein [Rhodocytophaga rosea]QHT67438.1 hypothetical protein GXP67_12760 [Rhodocytophaga rosea]
MGMTTSLYGCIIEHGVYNELREKICSHNDLAINSLPSYDEWPPLTKQMFAITQDSNFPRTPPSYEYWGRAIHFGGNFKSIEYEWKEWKAKFENLLQKLIWREAFVHFKTEYTDVQTFQWKIDSNKWSPYDKIEFGIINKEFWNFQGDQT